MLSNLENVGVYSNGMDETIKQIGNRLNMHTLHESDYFAEFEYGYKKSAEFLGKYTNKIKARIDTYSQ